VAERGFRSAQPEVPRAGSTLWLGAQCGKVTAGQIGVTLTHAQSMQASLCAQSV
jgi:hypothetical protein